MPGLPVTATYLDANCTALALQISDAGFASSVYRTTDEGPSGEIPIACGANLVAWGARFFPTTHAWRIGSAQPPAPLLYRREGSGCVQRGSGFDPIYALQRIAPSELVGATERIEPRGASMAIEVLEGDDGSSTTTEFMFDVALHQPCGPSYTAGVTNDYRCYPWAVGGASAGADCTSGAIASCGNAIAIDWKNSSACGPPTFSRLSNETEVSTVFADHFAAMLARLIRDSIFYTLGEPFDIARFPPLTSALVGTGRLRLSITHPFDDDRALFVNPELFAAEGRYAPGPFFDTDRGMACNPRLLEGGTMRCIPVGSPETSTYADAACTIPIADGPPPGDSCNHAQVTPHFAFTPLGLWPNDEPLRLYELGPLVSRSGVYDLSRLTTPACVRREGALGQFCDLVAADPSILPELG